MVPKGVSSDIDASLQNTDSSNRIGGKKRTFDLFKYAKTVSEELQTLDEFSNYNMLGIDHLLQRRKNF